MDTPLTTPTPPNFRLLLADSLRYWEFRRFLYNFVLLAVVTAWVAVTWPHFRPMIDVHSLLLLAILAFVANVLYCAAYIVDLPMLFSLVGERWRRRRWILWLAGMLLAILMANYWIADEIYPFVR